MASPLIALRKPGRPMASRRPPLDSAKVLIVDADRATGILLRHRLEQDYAASAEVAATYDEALDALGNAAEPTTLVMLDPAIAALQGDAILVLLRQHKARIHVTLHGNTPPEDLAFPTTSSARRPTLIWRPVRSPAPLPRPWSHRASPCTRSSTAAACRQRSTGSRRSRSTAPSPASHSRCR